VGLTFDATGRAPPAACLYFAYLLLSRLPPRCFLPLGNRGYAAPARHLGGPWPEVGRTAPRMPCGPARSQGSPRTTHRRGAPMRPRGAVRPCRRPDVRSHRPARAGGSRTGTRGPEAYAASCGVCCTDPAGSVGRLCRRSCRAVGLRLSAPRHVPWIRGAVAWEHRGRVPLRPWSPGPGCGVAERPRRSGRPSRRAPRGRPWGRA
jgi:hypothetical protein